jgi:hypothetical protein
MIEATTNRNAREAMERAHEERGRVLRDAWQWLFPSAAAR